MVAREHTSFLGRRSLLALVRARLSSAQLVTLTGPGGVGKTRVAKRVRDDLERSYPDGCWTVELADVGDGALIASTIADALDVQTQDVPRALDAICDHVGDRRALVLLDSCERLLDATAEVVEVLRSQCPHLNVLATSREPLDLSGEEVVPVPPLTVPEPGEQWSPESLAQYEAVALFAERATSAQPSFSLNASNAEAVAELCRALEGIPLAIELAAARIRALTPAAMLRQLTDRYALLSHGHRDMTERHRSLRSCVDWSFDLCDDAEKALWTRCAVFVGGFDLEAARAVCAAEDLPGSALLDLVEGLVDQSVLYADPGDGDVRYRMLDYIREYGLHRLDEADELDRWRGRHLTWCTELAAGFRTDWLGPRQGMLLRQLSREHGNLQAALELCARSPELAATGLTMAVDLDAYWVTSGRMAEARHWLGVGLDSGAGDAADVALALVFAARFAGLQHDLPRARALLGLASAKAEESDDDRARGLSLIPTAVLATWDHQHDAAVSASARAVELLTDCGDASAEMLAWSITGVCLTLADDPDGAAEAYERSVALSDAHGESFRKAMALIGLGELRLESGDVAGAAELFREALRLKADLGDRMGIAVALDGLARAAVAEDRGERAALLLGAVEAIWDVIGMVETGNPFAGTASRSEGIERARKLLGKQSFRAAFRRGAGLTSSAAVVFGLGDADTLEVPDTGRHQLGPSPLTRREAEVAELVADGLSNPAIAARLVISVRTAQGHVENILRKLGFTSRAMIAAWVTQRRLAAQAPSPDGGR